MVAVLAPEAALDAVWRGVRAAAAMRQGRPAETGPRSDGELLDWIEESTTHRIPDAAVCPDHDAPSQFVVDFYFHRVSDALVLANRAGGKTEDVAALHLANSRWKPRFETSHIGAIQPQARRCYAYYLRGLRRNGLSAMAPDPHITETVWSNGARIEILPGTEAQTQGGHPHLTTFDELEQGKRQPYENAKSMPVGYQGQIGQFLATSTRESALGLMQRALDEAAANGTRIYTWCVWETVDGRTCRDADGQPLCAGCPLFAAGGCGGRALHATGWRSREEIVAVYQRVGQDTWEAQHLCLQPDARALIYEPFSAANISEEAEYVPDGGPIHVWYDWGFTDPTHICILQERDGRYYQFDELVGNHRSEQEWGREIVRRIVALRDYDGPAWEQWERIWAGREPWPAPWPNTWPVPAAGDPSAVQFRAVLKDFGIGALAPKRIAHNVESGQDVLRAMIRSGDDERRLVIHPRCKQTIRALQNYRARELDDGSFDRRPDPDPANHVYSHGCDALRYGAWTQRRKLGLLTEGNDGDGDSA